MKKLVVFLIAIMLVGCSTTYCKEEHYAAQHERYSYGQCTAAVSADVAVSALIVAAAMGGSEMGGGKSSSASSNPCDCPGDLDSAGNRCGLRSAYSQAGGEAPYCPANRM